MGQSERKKRGTGEDVISESEKDSFDSLLQEIARDSLLDGDRPDSVSILPNIGEVIDGKYEIVEKLGKGGMGAVFSAIQINLNRRVAIKLMLPHQSVKKDAVQRFRREAELAGRINHPNVVRVYDIGQHKGGHYLVMERLYGESLSTLLKAGSVPSYRGAIALLMPVMRGVAAVHKEGIVHRDLKPGNIFLCKSDHEDRLKPKVLDFGVSKLLAQNNPLDPSLTTDNTCLGTLHYIAPEQIESNKKADCRADVYSLGVILYELITGRLPFSAEGLGEMVAKINAGSPQPPNEIKPELPKALSDIVMKAISRNPDDRFSSVKAFALALEPFSERVSFEPAESVTIVRSSPLLFNVKDRFKKSRLAWFSTLALLVVPTAWVIDSTIMNHWDGAEESTTPTTKSNRTAKKNTYSSQENSISPKLPSETLLRSKSIVQTENRPSETSATGVGEGKQKHTPRRSTATPNKTQQVPKPIAKPTTAKSARSKVTVANRDVTFINTLHATVKVKLKCPGFSREFDIPARHERVVTSVPRRDCQIDCREKGDPLLCFKLYSNRDKFRIRRISR